MEGPCHCKIGKRTHQNASPSCQNIENLGQQEEEGSWIEIFDSKERVRLVKFGDYNGNFLHTGRR